jgi:hypothetical protein
MTELVALSSERSVLSMFAPTPKAANRVVEFFTTQINNDHTRRAYVNAARRFSEWCAGQGIEHLSSVQPFHVAAFVKQLQGEFSPPIQCPTIPQRDFGIKPKVLEKQRRGDWLWGDFGGGWKSL